MFPFPARTAPHDAPWLTEYTRAASIEWQGDQVTVRNVRNFRYRTPSDPIPAWYDATYDLAGVQSVDMVVSHWAGEAIAHVFISFGFSDGRHLAISIETRRQQGQRYSTWRGFLRTYALIYVVADERDLIGVRTDIRRERVYLYPLNVTPQIARQVFVQYLKRVDDLNRQPEFYNTLFNNCTTNILRHAREQAPHFRYSWKILCSGYADVYTWELGLMDQQQPFAALKQAARIERAAGLPINEDFSGLIRASRAGPGPYPS
ncbi:Lnb N-terminal periplasmic domain-containing protein [Silvimonas iriomotensis]|uniref:Lnb N-terminal periplasmic domain-containing protein n=1 Tax=Silvimonas iriomotensis TaxID=449662 RepID=A0ABQ2PBV5_9NEIS|nr:DUF4105 domain-containing protein [Silvimonas iriomotensis]GGP22735.1 hypothetical protein GCM10010970_27350 [Silvimonas iriomotensis]